MSAQAQGSMALCADGSPPVNGWCVGDIFVGIGSFLNGDGLPLIFDGPDGHGAPLVQDGNGYPLPQLNSATPPVPTPYKDPAGNPVLQANLLADFRGNVNVPPYPVVNSSRPMRKTDGSLVCHDPVSWMPVNAPVGAAACPAGSYPLFEPVCLDGSGVDHPGGTIDSASPTNVTCPSGSSPKYWVTLPQIQNGGTFLQADQKGTFLTSGNQFLGVVNPEQGRTLSCAVDPADGHLWATDFFSNRVNEFAGIGVSPTLRINAEPSTFGTGCGKSADNPLRGCGAIGPILFASKPESGTTSDVFVGTSEGTNVVLRYPMPVTTSTPPDPYHVPVNANGLDLAADRETMFYTAANGFIRVFNIHHHALADTTTTDLGARLIANGLQLVDGNDQPITAGAPAAAAALYGRIPLTNRGFNQPIDVPGYQIRLLPPGDPLLFDKTTGQRIATGIIVALGTDIAILDLTPANTTSTVLTAQNRSGFLHDRLVPLYPELNDFFALEMTPDGRSFWTAGQWNNGDGTTTPKMIEIHIPTGAVQTVTPISAPTGASLNSLCIVKGYASGATQPDCSIAPGNILCKPLPPVCAPGSLDPDCTSPGFPRILSATPDLTNYEGDAVGLHAVSATDPLGAALVYTASGLPGGLQIDSASGIVSGQIDANGAGHYHVTVTVTSVAGSSQAGFDWTIAQWNLPPQLVASPPVYSVPVPQGVPMSIALSGRDPDACDTVWFLLAPGSGPLPPGLTMPQGVAPGDAVSTCNQHLPAGPFTTTIAGTPTSAGSFTFTILAKDNHETDTRTNAGGGVIVRGTGATQVQTFAIVVVPKVTNQPPVCTTAQPSVSELWPPNHKFASVSILNVKDPNSQTVTIAINRILQDEPTMGLGAGDIAIDGIVSGTQAQLRAERLEEGNGRVYVIYFTATNADGASCQGTVKVGVPEDKRNGRAIDSLIRFDSTVAGGKPLSGPEFNLPPIYVNPGNRTSGVGKSVKLVTLAADPNLDLLTYGATGLPPGLSVNAGNGVVSGTPTAPGSYAVRLKATDPFGGSSMVAFTWTVIANKPPLRRTTAQKQKEVRPWPTITTKVATRVTITIAATATRTTTTAFFVLV